MSLTAHTKSTTTWLCCLITLLLVAGAAAQAATFAHSEATKSEATRPAAPSDASELTPRLDSRVDDPKPEPEPESEGLLPALVHGVRGYWKGGQAIVEWQTGSPAATIGFQLHRLDSHGEPKPIHQGWIAPPFNAPAGSVYFQVDARARPGSSHKYVIVERDENASFHLHGPYTLEFEIDSDLEPVTGTQGARARQPWRDATERETKRAGDVDEAREPPQRDVIPTVTPKTVAKAFVRSTGLHRVTSAELAAALDQTVSKVELFLSRDLVAVTNQGNPVAWSTDTEGAELRFYATEIDSRYTRDNVYWIELGKPATLMSSTSAGAAPAQPGTYFQSQSHAEEDLLAAINATKIEGVDYWYWEGVRAEDPNDNIETFPLASPGVATGGGQAALTARFAGATKGSGYRYHNAVISVNGTEVGSILWVGLYTVEHTVYFDASLLAEQNTVQIEGTLIAGAIGSAFWVDSFDLTYPRYYEAEGDALQFTGDANAVVTVNGLTSSDAVVLDLANPSVPVILDAPLVEPQGAEYRVSFTPGDSATPHLVTTESALLSVDRLEADTFYSDPWQDASGFDYVVIVPEALKGPAERLMAHRASQGLSPYLLVLEDLHDFYADGIADPWAVRDFLAWTSTNWTTVPQYVFLVGKGTWDPKDYQGYGDNLITPVQAATPYGMAAADNLLADIDNDRIPDFAIGRLPVLTESQFDDYVDKLIAFETATGAWLDEALMLADNPDQAGDFTALSDAAITHLPAGMNATTVYLEYEDVNTARTNMFNTWTSGARIVNYIGHGGVDVLASESLLSNADMPTLESTGMPAAVSSLSCVVGQFEIPGWDALGESLLGVTDGGAVTMWAPTSPSYSGAAEELSDVYLDELGIPGTRVGDAVLASIQAAAPGSASFLLETFTLLGDPATRVR